MTDFAAQLAPEIPSLRRYARALSHDASSADDLVQSCLLRALNKQHLWQTGTSLRPWLFTMLHNLQVSRVRRSAREDRGNAAVEAFRLQHHEPRRVIELMDVERAIAKLPDWQREVLLLVGLEEMSYAQAAAKLGLPEGTVRSRLGRARAALRQLTDGETVEPATAAHAPAVSAFAARASAAGQGAPVHVH
jgi:RNA polymerase sigma-70 factor, ECF subfamily